MINRLFVVVCFAAFCSSSFATIRLTVTSPIPNSTSSAPLHLVASAVGTAPISGWLVYVDSQLAYQGPGSSGVDTWFPAPVGTHQILVRAVAVSNKIEYADQTMQVNVTPDGLPTPPPNAVVFDNIQQNGGWGSCNSSDCAGGSGLGVYWMAQNQTAPSLSGSSAEFYAAGVWENALWWQKLGNNSNAHNLLWDSYFYLDSNYNISAQALEFDAFQFIAGYNYMIGTECDYGLQVWDTWDELAGHWIHSNIACPRFAPNTWHHLQLYAQTSASTHQYTYVTIVVDGHSTAVDITGNAKYLNWGDNVGVQWQLDDNAIGSGYHEWMDNAKLTVW